LFGCSHNFRLEDDNPGLVDIAVMSLQVAPFTIIKFFNALTEVLEVTSRSMECFTAQPTQLLGDPIRSMSVDVKRNGSVVGIAVSYFESSGFYSGIEPRDLLLRFLSPLKQRLGAAHSGGPPKFLPVSFL
jgi:hypothetical protein